MSDKLICNYEDMVAVADAVRVKTGESKKYSVPQLREYLVKEITTPTISLPKLENPASEAEIFYGYETIDAAGNKKTGNFTIDNELIDQNSLLTSIVETLRMRVLEAAGMIVTDYDEETATLSLSLSNATVTTQGDTVVITG